MKALNIKSKSSVLLTSLLVAVVVSSCGGSSSPATETSGIMISGLSYDPTVKAVFTVNSSGNLCTLNVSQVPNNVNCALKMPAGVIISSQVVSDGNGHIYAIGTNASSGSNYILKYDAQTSVWSTTSIELPYLANRNKLLYRAGNLYASNPNTKTLYIINIAANTLQQINDYFIESAATVEDFDSNGDLLFSHITNNLNPATFRTDPATTVYNLPSGTSGFAAQQFGANNVNINDLVYASNNNVYACSESNFLYLPITAGVENWQVLHDGAGYFSCDYVTTDNTNLYYVEGTWLDNSTFSNGYINKKAI